MNSWKIAAIIVGAIALYLIVSSMVISHQDTHPIKIGNIEIPRYDLSKIIHSAEEHGWSKVMIVDSKTGNKTILEGLR